MMKRKPVKSLSALLLAVSLSLALPLAAYADEPAAAEDTAAAVQSGTAENAAADEIAVAVDMTIFDEAELTKLVESFVADHASNGVKAENISIAFTYTATGESWFYNPDEWYYSASLYKVPLMMILAQMEAEGELTQESNIKGLSLAEAESSILTYSHNDFAHLMLNYLGTDQEAREMYKQFSSLPDDYYDPDFIDYSYFSVRFMNDVMTTLYNNPERFPHIADCLKLAQPNGYFHLKLDPSIVIAQKYGSYKEFNNTSGIFYTENPFILTVMTENITQAEQVLGDAAKVFAEYSSTLDAKLGTYKVEKAAAEETARREAEEAARIKAEQDAELAEQIEAQRQAEELARLEVERAEQERLEKQERRAKMKETLKSVGVVAVAATALILSAVVIIKRHKNAPGREEEAYAAGGRRAAYSEPPRGSRRQSAYYDGQPSRRERPAERYGEAPIRRERRSVQYDETAVRRERRGEADRETPRYAGRREDDYYYVPTRRERQSGSYGEAPARRERREESYAEMPSRSERQTERRPERRSGSSSGRGGYTPKH